MMLFSWVDEDDKVKQAAAKIGCNTLKNPFSYLGSKVGGCMSRIQSWNETIERMACRLFKWKLKTLSIGDKGGLGVSSLFALNRALMFKWVWRFITQGSSLWATVIKVLHGYDGKIGHKVKSCYPSLWLDIIHEVKMFMSRGIDLVSLIHSKLGNGANTSFWELAWRGDHRLNSFFLGSSEFTIMWVRKLIEEFMLPEVSSKMRWIKVVPIKVNVHAWKVKLGGLPTRLNISRRGIDIESILCPMCGKAVESTSHILFTRQMSKEILRKISRWWDIDYMEISSYEELLVWILNTCLSVKSKQLFEGVCYVLWWHVWNFRNKTIFGSQIPSKAMIFDDVVSRLFYWCRYRCKVSFSWIEWLKNSHLISL
nr:RNA-directed DNA polymerase, eukaryota [Tanacetum cinerariifolium]